MRTNYKWCIPSQREERKPFEEEYQIVEQDSRQWGGTWNNGNAGDTKEGVSYPIGISMNDLNIFNDMPDSVVLYFASICRINIANKEKQNNEIGSSY